MTLFFFIVQVLTGILLMLYYRPSAEEAFESVEFIMTTVPFGATGVSAEHAFETEVRLYERLFTAENPDTTEEGKSFLDHLNPDSFDTLENAQLEPSLKEANPGDRDAHSE